MNNIFLKPLKTIIFVVGIMILGVFADVATLTQFNIITWFKEHLPWSLIGGILILLILYIGLVIYYYFYSLRNDSTKDVEGTKNVKQSINAKKIEGSTINMVGGNLNEDHKND
ncbi:hypothetical protein ABH17_026935 (plasmid) [Bacillus toyonensis]|uniref:hypothetical protein n=1 Tax=Bacillus toyonensis TaxID=155322 RepID=UPI0006AA2DD3|nr:hypothetical protein [Bacillus toyonensis]OKO50957.1 hypothetical protein ABH17_026935 [Bacillus toyonensis]